MLPGFFRYIVIGYFGANFAEVHLRGDALQQTVLRLFKLSYQRALSAASIKARDICALTVLFFEWSYP